MRTSAGWLTTRPGAALAIAAGIFALVAAARWAGALVPLELGVYDRLLPAPAPRSDTPLVLVAIREQDIRRFGHPICDGLLARALSALLAAGPRVVGVDLYRDAPVPCLGDDGRADSGPELAEVVGASDRVVMVMKFADPVGDGTAPPAYVDPERVGFSDLPIDEDGVVRRGLLYLWDEEGRSSVSFALRLALRHLRDDGIGLEADPEQPQAVRLGATTLAPFRGDDGAYVRADEGGYQFLLDYRHGARQYPSADFGALLRGDAPPELFEDRVAVLGTFAPSVKDDFVTPYEARAGGVEIHAHAVSQLLALARGDARPITGPGEWAELSWIFLFSVLGAALGLSGLSLPRVAAAGTLGAAALVGGGGLLLARSFWVPIAAPGLAGVLAAGTATAFSAVRERARRQEVTRLFSRFLHPRVADEIWRQRDQFMSSAGTGLPLSRSGVLTALLSDIAGYTAASEKLEPEALVRWINEYLKAMGRIVERHGGVVEDYAGDGIKVNFGFPVPAEGEEEVAANARAAVRCALEMGQEVERLDAEWSRTGLPAPRVRIGIVTGPAVFGTIGSGDNMKYTAMGDTVNTAARLETFGKDEFGADPAEARWRILIAEETLKRLGGAFRTVDLGAHELRGKRAPVHIYRVLGPMGEGPPDEESPR